jgi:hypothetical protein
METLNIKGTKDIPEVHFDKSSGTLFMGGSSLPENVFDIFNPIMDWLEEYRKEGPAETKVEFNFEYLNTSSTNMVSRLIQKLEDINERNNLEITWYYPYGDYDMKELGEDLLYAIECNYNLIEVEVAA